MHNSRWQKSSWKEYKLKHIPDYQDSDKLNEVTQTLNNFPPLVFAGEVRSLKRALAKVAEGDGFILQGGDCAESFAEFHPELHKFFPKKIRNL